MSQASDLVAELKQLVADVTKEIKSFEGDFEELGQFTDLAHLNIAKIHLSELRGVLVGRRENLENAELARMEAEEQSAPEPAVEQAPVEPTAEPASEPPPVEPEPEPSSIANLVAPPA
jgi:DNA anti-recombination protein RmuC